MYKCKQTKQLSSVFTIFTQGGYFDIHPNIKSLFFLQNNRQGICWSYNLSWYNILTGSRVSFQIYAILILGVMDSGEYSIDTQTETVLSQIMAADVVW